MKIPRARINDLLSRNGESVAVVSLPTEPDKIEKYLDKEIDIEIKSHREHRSLDANALLWACIGDMARYLVRDNWGLYMELLRRYGQYTTVLIIPEAVEELKKQYRAIDEVGETEVDGVDMAYVNCYYGSSTYDTKQFSQLLEGTIQDMKDLGLEPPPSEDMKRALEQWEATHDKAK